jgi:hypothetical protein
LFRSICGFVEEVDMTQPYTGYSGEVERILASDLPELEKVAQAFGSITRFVVEYARGEIELARALQDHEEMVKIQIKRETMAHARDVFAMCYLRVTGRRPWDETD